MLNINITSKKYKKQTIIKDFILNIETSDFISIIGPSGCGKTTLLNIISNLDNKFEGKVLFNKSKYYSCSQKPIVKSLVHRQYCGFGCKFRGYCKDLITNGVIPKEHFKYEKTYMQYCNKNILNLKIYLNMLFPTINVVPYISFTNVTCNELHVI